MPSTFFETMPSAPSVRAYAGPTLGDVANPTLKSNARVGAF